MNCRVSVFGDIAQNIDFRIRRIMSSFEVLSVENLMHALCLYLGECRSRKKGRTCYGLGAFQEAQSERRTSTQRTMFLFKNM